MAIEQWYYSRGSERLGPIPAETLQSMAANGQISPHDFVWRDGMTDWTPAYAVPGLFQVAAPNPSAPYPAQQPSFAPMPYPGQPNPTLGYSGPQPVNYYAAPQYATRPGFWLRFVAGFLDTGEADRNLLAIGEDYVLRFANIQIDRAHRNLPGRR